MYVDGQFVPTLRVPASATADRLRHGDPSLWLVKVWGEPPYPYTRVYTLEGKTDGEAAMAGIGRFVEEMHQMVDAAHA